MRHLHRGNGHAEARLRTVLIEFETRRVQIAGCTSRPNGRWIVQQARNLFIDLEERHKPLRFLLHDRDSKFGAAFDEVFRSEGVREIKTPVRAPNANAFAERWVRTVRHECLDWLLITGRRQLQTVLDTYADHCNHQRPHRALALDTGDPPAEPVPLPLAARTAITRGDRLGGLLHEYQRAA
jgi:putative transposase